MKMNKFKCPNWLKSILPPIYCYISVKLFVFITYHFFPSVHQYLLETLSKGPQPLICIILVWYTYLLMVEIVSFNLFLQYLFENKTNSHLPKYYPKLLIKWLQDIEKFSKLPDELKSEMMRGHLNNILLYIILMLLLTYIFLI